MLGNLALFMTDAEHSVEFKDKFAEIESTCELEYRGSQVYKQLPLLVSQNLDACGIHLNF